MSTNPWDRAFRDRMEHNTASVPSGTWEAIQANLPKQAAKSRRGLWLTLLMIGIALTLGWMVLESDNASSSSTNIAAIANPENRSGGVVVSASGMGEIPRVSSSQEAEKTEPQARDQEAAVPTPTPTATTQRQIANVAPEETEERKEVQIEAVSVLTNVESRAIVQTAANTSVGMAEAAPESRSSVQLVPLDVLYTTPEIQITPDVTVTDCYSFGKVKRGRWLIEAYTGPSYSLKSLSSRAQENVDDYIVGRDSTESAQISWNAGLRFGYEHYSGVTAKVGIHYTLVNELFKLETRTSGVLIDTTFDNMGNIISIDTSFVDGVRTKQTQNRYHSVDIPLLIGYRVDNGDWDFGIEAGPLFNIVHKAKGDMIDAAGEPFSFSDTSDPSYQEVFKDRLGVSIYAGLYASKRIGTNMWAFVEPHIQYRLKSVTVDSYPIEQKQTSIGLSLGIRLKL